VHVHHPERVAKRLHEELSIPDAVHDQMEIRYLKISRKFKKPNTVVHKMYPGLDETTIDYSNAMQEVDFTCPSVQLVLSKYGTSSTTK